MRLQIAKRISHFIASCNECDGTGLVWEEDWNYHKGTDNGKTVDCSTCEGQGRLIRVEKEYRASLGYEAPVILKQETSYLPYSREVPKNTWEVVGSLAIE